jgi:hypothetical protein
LIYEDKIAGQMHTNYSSTFINFDGMSLRLDHLDNNSNNNNYKFIIIITIIIIIIIKLN